MSVELVAELLKLTAIAGLAIAAILSLMIWKKGRTSKVTYIKFVVQALALVGTFYLFSYTIRPLYITLVILLMPIILGRFFCGWLCPYGLVMDVITVIRKAVKIRYRIIPDRLNKMLHNLKYVLIIGFLILAIVFSIMDPPSTGSLTMIIMHFAGPFEHMGILLSPLNPIIVPWTGPLEIAGIYFSYPYIQEVIKYTGENFATISALVFLVLTVVSSFFFRRFWCRFCPTGVSIAVLNKIKAFRWAPVFHLYKNEEKCTKCGICKRVCPVQVTEVYEKKGGKIMTSMCMLCARCVEMCPYEDCLKIKFGNKT
ncbi:MAG: 4Fe-4S binding protein, partial [Candidatus Bathyarchaeota archaeon]|nr:4Fe-4S binding protein [Candidatus Bathyarchaeota archaeon]